MRMVIRFDIIVNAQTPNKRPSIKEEDKIQHPFIIAKNNSNIVRDNFLE